jgi:4-hydroxybenzoate polyprenyltransferase
MVFDALRLAGSKFTGKVKDYGTLVMFSHTVFSLSFAVISMLLAANGLPSLHTTVWVLLAFLGARTGANALNRAIDAEIDALNPRTAARQIPRKLLGKPEVIVFACVCFVVLGVSAAMLNPLCLILSPVALFLMVFYSYTKRFTWLCHLILGVTTACAPVGAWLAVTGKLAWTPLIMGAANTLWVAGFDIIYGSQDYAFDKANGLHSIPEHFGVKNALGIAAAFHTATVLCLATVGFLSPRLGVIYQAGVCIIAVLLVAEHRIVSPDILDNVKIASYGINQLVSVVFLIAGVLDALI